MTGAVSVRPAVAEDREEIRALGLALDNGMLHIEGLLRDDGPDVARVLIVETSSTAAYEGARQFHAGRGFAMEAVIREFYGPGDDKVVFWKSLVT